jgi:hypothetical protein
MLAGSGAPPPEENPTERKYNFFLPPQSRSPAYWPVISANALIEARRKSWFWRLFGSFMCSAAAPAAMLARICCTSKLNLGYAQASGDSMHMHARNGLLAPGARRWSRSRERSICPRRHLRVLPTRTRPSLFGGD